MVIEKQSFGSPKKKTTGFEKQTVVKEEKMDLGEFVEEMVSIINNRFSDLERNIRKLKTDVSSLNSLETDVNKLESDIKSVKRDISSLKGAPKLKLDKKTLKSLEK